jgi:hypothetical protein
MCHKLGRNSMPKWDNPGKDGQLVRSHLGQKGANIPSVEMAPNHWGEGFELLSS